MKYWMITEDPEYNEDGQLDEELDELPELEAVDFDEVAEDFNLYD